MKGRKPLQRGSLLSRYLLIVLLALLFIPVVLPLTMAGYGIFDLMTQKPAPPGANAAYASVGKLEKLWHEAALNLAGKDAAAVDARLKKLHETYPKAAMFWVDGAGTTRLQLKPAGADAAAAGKLLQGIPAQWDAAAAIQYMKDSRDTDPVSIVAFMGDKADAGQGFMVMQIPAALTKADQGARFSLWYFAVFFLFFLFFASLSWMFFIGIRRRLLRLQTAMSFREASGLPQAVIPGRLDEIGRLEIAFNTMVGELAAGREREAAEDELRRRLIADLSHDLRTPLTVIRSHLHVLDKENLSGRGKESLSLMDQRIESLSGLIDNLLSYNLLSSGKVTLKAEKKEMLRLVRESAAAWYPLWEKEGFQIEIDLEGEPLYWTVDESWFRRILDNLYQNVVRHAFSGQYIRIAADTVHGRRAIVIEDHGKGMEGGEGKRGAGLGLSIVDLLLKRMGLGWAVKSTKQGTSIAIFHPGAAAENLNQF